MTVGEGAAAGRDDVILFCGRATKGSRKGLSDCVAALIRPPSKSKKQMMLYLLVSQDVQKSIF